MAFSPKLLQMGASGAGPANYIEEVFSTYLYTGNSTARSITNDIDLSTKGGLVWLKNRSVSVVDPQHTLTDTARGATKWMESSGTGGQVTTTNTLTAFNTNGFSLGVGDKVNENGITYASWTFRKQPKFFDVVTYTGDGTNGRAISHNLGSTPGFIIVKSTSDAAQWVCWSRGFNSGNGYGYLNDTTAWFNTGEDVWGNGTSYIAPTSTTFTVKGGSTSNLNGRTYVAYLFAHNAGGFGLTGTDSVISCGSYVGDVAAGQQITLGWEPQWTLIRASSTTDNWRINDNMRGVATGGVDFNLFANLTNAENSPDDRLDYTATGFTAKGLNNSAGETFIYIAIRRGPMKVPTSGTSVFEPVAYTGTGTNNRIITSSITPDSVIPAQRNDTASKYWYDRLRGSGTFLVISGTNAEGAEGGSFGPQFNKVQTGYQQGTSDSSFLNSSTLPTTYINYLLKRAPSFFDEVCYVGTGSNRTVTHNLTVAPELMLIKNRTTATSWVGYCAALTATQVLVLNSNATPTTNAFVFLNTEPTSTVFTVGAATSGANENGANIVAYLFATCAGVSKVGSYTGTGTTLQINCGFTGGARFVLIKRTDSTGDWYIWDTARGIIAGNDPYLLLNSSAAEVTNTDYIDSYSAGFELSSTAPAAINANGGTYIFLAIA